MMKKIILLILVLPCLTVGITACQKQVITVADMQAEGEEEPGYIQIEELELKDAADDSNEESDVQVRHCIVVIPGNYVESEDVPHMYLHERNPLDSSNIYYTISDSFGDGWVSEELTAKIYKQEIEAAYQEQNNGTMDLTVESFERQDIEGVPAYVIQTTCQIEDSENVIEQLIYLIRSDKTYTITYTQSADDELMAAFEVNGSRIKLVRE